MKQEKIKVVKELKQMASKYEVVGILNLHKMPAKQLQGIKQSIKESAAIKVAKKTLLEKVLKESGKEDLISKIKDEPALLFSNDNPFKLFKIIKKSRTSAGAKVGDIAPNDITISKGPTSQAPGPAISTFQKVGLKTTVEKGKIAIAQDKVVAKAGDVINEDHVNVFSLMKLEPMEVGLDLLAVFEKNIIYDRNVLDVDTEEYLRNIELSVHQALNLSLNTGYLTSETAPIAVHKAFIEARQLALEANILDASVIGDLLAKASREAKALEDAAPIKSE